MKEKRIPENRDLIRGLNKELIRNSKVSMNLSNDSILVTKDKMKLLLFEYKDSLEKRQSWQFSLGVFLTVLPTLVASDFKDAFGISAEAWSTILLLF